MPDQSVVEKHTIGYVPPEDRHGKVRDLFTLWFGTNIAPLPVVTGAAGITVFGLDLFWCVIAIIVGHLVGGVFMALHSAQGPQMGIPQMIQSRGQFGSYGALIVVVIAAVMYLAFFASNIVLAGQSLHGIAEGIPVSAGIILGAIGSGLICVIGYRFIHALNKIATVVLGIGIVVGVVAIFVQGVPASFWTQGSYTTAGFLATVSLGALWQIAFAPYVSDYSRYLPANVGVRATFTATYLGLHPRVDPAVRVRCCGGTGHDTRRRRHGGGRRNDRRPRPVVVGALPGIGDQPQRPESVRHCAVADHLRADVRGAMDPHRAHTRGALGRGDDRVGVLSRSASRVTSSRTLSTSCWRCLSSSCRGPRST